MGVYDGTVFIATLTVKSELLGGKFPGWRILQ